MILEIFKNKRGKCQVRLKAQNGRILMHSEEYERHQSAVKIADRIQLLSSNINIIDKGNKDRSPGRLCARVC